MTFGQGTERRGGGHAENWKKSILAETNLYKGPEAGKTAGFLLSHLLKRGLPWLLLDGSKSAWEVGHGVRGVI